MTTTLRKTITIELSADLVDALNAAAAERVIGRKKLIELLLTEAVAGLVPVDEMHLLRQPTPVVLPAIQPPPWKPPSEIKWTSGTDTGAQQ